MGLSHPLSLGVHCPLIVTLKRYPRTTPTTLIAGTKTDTPNHDGLSIYWSFVLRLLSARWAYGKGWTYSNLLITPEKQALRRRRQAVWIRETLLDLGPTFIKVGQLFSTRADLFPH